MRKVLLFLAVIVMTVGLYGAGRGDVKTWPKIPKNKIAGVWKMVINRDTYYKVLTPDGRYMNLNPNGSRYYIHVQGYYRQLCKHAYVETAMEFSGRRVRPSETAINFKMKDKDKMIITYKGEDQKWVTQYWTRSNTVPIYK